MYQSLKCPHYPQKDISLESKFHEGCDTSLLFTVTSSMPQIIPGI